MLDLEALGDKYEDEFIEFERIENPPHPRRDICAFILLDRLCPGPAGKYGQPKMISGAGHDVIWLDPGLDELAAVATEDDILTLVRCGVCFGGEYDCLYMFV